MSHYSVIVCLEEPGKLEEALAPYDEGLEVEPYRSYEEGEAADHYLYRSLRRADENDRNGTGILPYKPDQIGWSSDSSKETPEVQRQKIAADAALFRSLPSPITWADIARLHNERYDDESDRLLYDAEAGRAYSMSTYNPDSKWDWYQIGGRWTGYFRKRPDAVPAHLIEGEPGLMTPRNTDPAKCDGGRKDALDLEGMRKAAAEEAHGACVGWQVAIKGTPDARPWREFVELVDKVEGYTIDQAREEYGSQPRVQKIRGTGYDPTFGCAIETYQMPEKQFVELARAAAVPGFAVLTLDGKWMAPGEMGWFGASSDDPGTRAGYYEVANAYLDSLPDSTWLIAVDCHI